MRPVVGALRRGYVSEIFYMVVSFLRLGIVVVL